MLEQLYQIPNLPPPSNFETISIFKSLAAANRALAELKGQALSIPNQGILIDTLALQEAKASSEIENIVTTQDDLFRAELFPEGPASPAAKEVSLYRDALKLGFQQLHETKGVITSGSLIRMFQLLKSRDDGFRTLPGTALKNELNKNIVYVPPQKGPDIVRYMTALVEYVNDDELCDLDPLIKMAIIHHQFESIHPFPDGNGRIGRILNVLYLTRVGLLDIPILYLSRHIIQTKADYYRLLQGVRDEGLWEEWVLYMLAAVTATSHTSLRLLKGIRTLMGITKSRMRSEVPHLYSQDLLNNLYRHPYTRIDYVKNDLGVSRQTASKYLDQLAEKGFVENYTIGRDKYYVNQPLLNLLVEISETPTAM